MDNLAAHKAKAVRKALDAARIDYRHLPACSPDLNPSGATRLIRSRRDRRLGAAEASPVGPSSRPGCGPRPRTLKALEAELGPALTGITAQEAQGWFRHRGYPAPL